MLNIDDRDEILGLIRTELENAEMVHHPGTFTHLCAVGGVTMLTHRPVGQVVRYVGV